MNEEVVVASHKDRKGSVLKEFSRFANQYDHYSVIQAEVARTLIESLERRLYTQIVDVGCGSGEVYKHLDRLSYPFDHFIAIDFSKEMLDLHPSSPTILKHHANFNEANAFEGLELDKNRLFISSSALQWSRDLDFTVAQIAKVAPRIHFAIFTSNTFKTLHETANITSPIHSKERLKEVISTYYKTEFEVRSYTLKFESVQAIFSYIKKSGVSGGESKLSFKEIKALLKNYPLDYLEFEVLFVQGDSMEKK
jgi:malonyl-CoA O-methyltransferase